MYKLTLISALFCCASAQLAAWPGSSFSPYYQAILGPARTPVNSVPVIGQGVAPGAIPAPPAVAAPVFAAPAFPLAAPVPAFAPLAAPAPVFAAPLPVAAPAASVLRGPAYAYAPSPVLAPVRPAFAAPAPLLAPAPVFAAPALPVVPRFVPAYSPFATSAVFIGSNKGSKTA